MHMADALVSPAVGGVMLAASAGALAYSAKQVKKSDLSESKLPIMGIMGAFIFAAQMINFTIPATGSSGHIGGGMLLAAVLGPFASLFAIAAVLIIQCLLFADGGLLALGCNIFNMGVVPCLLVYPLVYKPIVKAMNKKTITIASVLSTVVALQLGAFLVVAETSASKITALPFGTFVALMQPIHLAIGLVEGFVTALVLCFIHKARPEILNDATSPVNIKSVRKVLAVLAALTLVVGGGLSLYASEYPDGLEWSILNVTGSEELEPEGKADVYDTFSAAQESTAFMPDYDYKSKDVGSPLSGTTVAGITGAVIVFVLSLFTGIIIKKCKV